MRKVLALLFSIIFVSVAVVEIVLKVQYTQDIGGHLKRAGDANSVEMAKQELKVALANMESRGLTSGYTSVLWKTPDEDIGFWYNNIRTSYVELDSLPANASALERSNMLIKLRETLLDQGSEGTKVTDPDGISRFPHNRLFALWLGISFALTMIGWVSVYREDYF